MRRRLGHRLGLVTLALLTAAPGWSQSQDPDALPKVRLTSQDVVRFNPVPDAALHAPDPEMRAVAREVAQGATDVRLLRAYYRLFPRLYPFEEAQPPDVRRRAKAVRDALAAQGPAESAPPTTGCWAPLGPRNIPGRMTALVVHPTDPAIIYAAGADGGVWKTTDRGGAWTPLGDTEVTLAVGALAIDPIDPNVLYAGTGEANYAADNLAGAGMLKSVDGGATWSLSSRFAARFHEIVFDPLDHTHLLAATTTGLFESRDSGGSWTLVASLPAEDTTTVMFSRGTPGVILAGIGRGFGSSPNTGLYRSADGGASFARVGSFPAGGNNGRLKVAPSANPQRIYGAVHNTGNANLLGAFRSDDEGLTWSPITTPPNELCGYPPNSFFCWYCLVLTADPGDPDVAYIGGVPIYRTTDGGSSWTAVINTNANDGVHVDQHQLLCPRSGSIWSANDGGINHSEDQGATWTHTGRTLETAQYYHFTTDPTDDTYAIGGTQDQGTHRFAFSANWSHILGGDGAFTAIDPQNPNVYYGSSQYLNLSRSDNRGASWTGIGGGIAGGDRKAFIAPFILDRATPTTVYAGTQRLWRSVNRGTNFTAVSPDLTNGGVITAIDNCRDFPTSLWVGSSDGRVSNSPDGGVVWDNRSAGLPNRSITSISAHPTSPLIAYVSVGGTGTGHIWRTDDGGATWADVSSGLPDIHFNRVLVFDDLPTSIVAGADLGFYRSDDSGASWYVYGTDLPNVAVDWLSYGTGTGTLRAGTHGRGAWQLAPPDTCLLPPAFDGLVTASIDPLACLPRLDWADATSTCTLAPGVSYNVYGAADPLMTPGPGNLLVAGLMATDYLDTSAVPGTPRYYAVRAESGETTSTGPANGGQEDRNSIVLWAEAGDFGTQLDDDGGDSDAWLGSSAFWSVGDDRNSTPAGRFSYHSAPRGSATHGANVCAGIETPQVLLGPGATLSYQASYNLEESWDGVVVEISTDGGMSWLDLPPGGGYPGDFSQTQSPPINACGFAASRAAFSGPPGNAAPTPFAAYSSDLSAYAGQRVRIRWLLSSDPGFQVEGFYLDDVSLGPIVPDGAAPDMGNVLLAVKELGAPRFTWSDIAVTGYRVYESIDRQMAGRTLVAEVPSGTPGVLDGAARTAPVHYYRLHAVAGCGLEGP